MNWGKCLVLGTVGLVVGLFLLAPSARALSEAEMTRIVGAGIVDFCDTVGHNHAAPSRCNGTGSFACTNLCDPCAKLGAGACGTQFCWKCVAGGGPGNIQECQAFTGTGCTEFGGGQACGNKHGTLCVWFAGSCSCPTVKILDLKQDCPRRHCL